MNKLLTYLLSCLIGLVNALFGAGGGLIAVPLFKKLGLSQKEAQASAISVVMPLCIVSITAYYFMGYINFKDALGYVPFGVAGSFVGTRLMKKNT